MPSFLVVKNGSKSLLGLFHAGPEVLDLDTDGVVQSRTARSRMSRVPSTIVSKASIALRIRLTRTCCI